MKSNDEKLELIIEGPISEKTTLFGVNFTEAKKINLNLEKVTFINSIGVKNWITWTLRVPKDAEIKIVKSPYVIINQANIVQGFLQKNMQVDSFYAPFICDECSDEQSILLQRGSDFEYVSENKDSFFKLPENLKCKKCAGIMEPDFIPEKTFAFLKRAF